MNVATQAKMTTQTKITTKALRLTVPMGGDNPTDYLTHKAQLHAMLDGLAAKITERGMVITLGDDAFGTDLAPLNLTGMHVAKKLAHVLLRESQRTVLIEGFTDSVGSPAHNQELSERRATAVRFALQELGVSRERVAIRGYGETYPIAANDTAPNRQLNRRVEIVLSDQLGKVIPRNRLNGA